MNKITIELTEDQKTYLQTLVTEEQTRLLNEGATTKHGMYEFAERVRIKLAKAKS